MSLLTVLSIFSGFIIILYFVQFIFLFVVLFIDAVYNLVMLLFFFIPLPFTVTKKFQYMPICASIWRNKE